MTLSGVEAFARQLRSVSEAGAVAVVVTCSAAAQRAKAAVQSPNESTCVMTIAQKINGERLVVLGWGRAILLQLAHPLVAAGVSQHSGFAARRFARLGRLHATVGAMLDLTFGDEAAVGAAAGRINAIHDRVNGYLEEDAGEYRARTRYSATDPDLLAWVHATLLDSMPLAYERFVGPLTTRERDGYCAESANGARRLRIPIELVPTNAAALEQYLLEMLSGRRLHVTSAARQVAHDLLYPPLADPTRPSAWLVRLVTIGLLPAGIRDAYGFRWTPGHARALRSFAGLARTIRPFLPTVLARFAAARGGKR